ncbi:TonB-dependent receptor domain-containing protein [Echinimonas agarilytica]|uniref:TonB-dependent receptor n=1 Tax=Echinimonas agarilytica TaxID=1215918 RepID=A0AA41W5I8_9GAMM|nr:TonB-dependent receptor [Echinimonas agarilytica]MCM2679414.1 TonB-dependent receptor [Echinimonas agarilytica]
MFQKHILANSIQKCLWSSLALSLMTSAVAAEQTDNSKETSSEPVEVISVKGVRSSLKEAAYLKKSADQIMDAISAEDIGQLPDNNIAEALQRVTGVQIGRDDTGAGSGFQVRGLSQNRVEVNGQSMAGSGGSRSNDFGNIDTALFKAIEVYKSPTADMVEGAIGATIRLKTFTPLERNGGFVNVSGQGSKDELADDTGNKFSLAMSDRWDWGKAGEFGALVNVSTEKRFAETHEMKTAWSPAIENQLKNNKYLNGSLRETSVGTDGNFVPRSPGDVNVPYAVFRPEDIEFKRSMVEQSNLSLDSTLQWRPTDNLEFSLFGQKSDFERIAIDQVMKYGTRHESNQIMDYDLIGTERDDSPIILGEWNRSPNADEYFLTQDFRNRRASDSLLQPTDADFVQSNGMLERYIVQSATVTPTGSAYHAPVASQYGSGVSTTDSSTWSFTTKYDINDAWRVEAKYAYARSKNENDSIAQRFSPGTNAADAESNALTNAYVYYDFDPSKDIPNVGVLNVSSDGLSSTPLSEELQDPNLYALHNGWGFLTTDENEKDEFSLDFDWAVDGDVITSIEFGGRYANNDMKRHKQKMEFSNAGENSRFSTNWLAYDRDLSTRPEGEKVTGNDKVSIGFADQVMFEQTGIEDYYSRHMVSSPSMFPNASGVNVDPWLTLDMSHDSFKELILGAFPGREGDCLIYDKSEGLCSDKLWENPEAIENNDKGYQEWDHVLTIPKAQYVVDGTYPYLITEKTKAVYLKFNFNTEVMNYIVTGNLGARYVETETTSLGVKTTRFRNDEGQELKDLNGLKVEQYDPVSESSDYSNFLPSLNVNVLLTDDMFVRLAAAKTMARANPKDLSPSLDLPNYSWTANLGNPNLRPEEAINYDVSWEWYINEINSLSAAVFFKDLSNFHTNRFYTIASPADRNGDGDYTNDPVTVKQPINGGDGTIKGIELAALHTFDYLPGFLSGFGVQANYTYTDSSQDSGTSELDGSELPVYNLSEESYNFILFYDKAGFNFRAAYNYRTENLQGTSTAGTDPYIYTRYDDYQGVEGDTQYSPTGIQLPEWNDDFATLDLSASYRYKQATVFVQARNVLGESGRRYVGDETSTKHLLTRYQDTGTDYVAGVRVSF